MRVLFDHPAKVSWRLKRLTEADGTQWILSGWYGNNRAYGVPDDLAQARRRGAREEDVKNVVVEAALRATDYGRGRSAVRYTMTDRDDGREYEVGGSAMLTVVQALQDGRLRVEGGCIVGRFTFHKQGEQVYLHVYDGPATVGPQYGDATGAVDVSDLVAALPAAKR